MGLKNLTISMILIFLFVIAIVSFGVGITSDSGASRSITDDDSISNLFNNVSSASSGYNSNSDLGIQAYKNSTTVVGGDTPQKSTEESLFTSIYRVPQQTFGIVFNFIYIKIFGGDTAFLIIFTTIASFIAVLFVAYVVRAIRSGEVD